MLKIIDRYFLTEQLKPFLAGVSAFLIIMISNTLYIFMEMIVKNNVPLKTVVRLLLYSLPAIVVVTLPVAYMFATLLSLGRLGRDSEIIALRACGVSLTRCIMPVIMMSIAISAFGYALQEKVVPWANKQTVAVLKDIMKRDPAEVVVPKRFLDSEKRSFYVEDVDREKGELQQIYVIDKSEQGFPQVIEAEKALKKDVRWELHNGILRKLDYLGFVDHEIKFERMEIELKLQPDRIFSDRPDVRSLSGAEAKKVIDEKVKNKQNVSKDLVDYYTKFSLPLATFFTILLAAPVGIKFSRMGNYFGVAISIALVFVWYVLYSTFSSLGGTGKVNPFLAAWIQNILFGGIGILFLLQLSGVPILKVLLFPFFIPGWIKEWREVARWEKENPRLVKKKSALAFLLTTGGQLGRRNYAILSVLCFLAVGIGAYGVDTFWPELVNLLKGQDSIAPYLIYQEWGHRGLFGLLAYVLLHTQWCLGAKRAHDLGKNAWFQLWHLIPGLGSLYVFVQFLFKKGVLLEDASRSEALNDEASWDDESAHIDLESSETLDEERIELEPHTIEPLSDKSSSPETIVDMRADEALNKSANDISEREAVDEFVSDELPLFTEEEQKKPSSFDLETYEDDISSESED